VSGTDVTVRDLAPEEHGAAAALLSRAMSDNPINVAVYGDDRPRRERRVHRLFETLFRVVTAQTPLTALDGGRIVAVAGIAPPGACQPGPRERLKFLPGIVALGPPTATRVLRWLNAWAAEDPATEHSHFGPFGVEPALQGRGIGTQVLHEYCRGLDEVGLVGYLETDKEVNVRLYQRFGFEVVGESTVLGVRCWYQRRPAS
jgi:GNAT superfamily N-acetyltransferase